MRFYLFFIKSLIELVTVNIGTVFGIAPALFYENCFVFPGEIMKRSWVMLRSLNCHHFNMISRHSSLYQDIRNIYNFTPKFHKTAIIPSSNFLTKTAWSLFICARIPTFQYSWCCKSCLPQFKCRKSFKFYLDSLDLPSTVSQGRWGNLGFLQGLYLCQIPPPRSSCREPVAQVPKLPGTWD